MSLDDVREQAPRKQSAKRSPSCLAANASTERDGHWDHSGQIGQQCWPVCPNPALAWLVNATSEERYLDCIFFELCRKLRMQGVPLVRASVFLQIIHPQWCMLQVFWLDGIDEPKLTLFGFDETCADPFYAQSLAAMSASPGGHEHRVQLIDGANTAASIEHLRSENITDYIAWSLPFTLGKRHLIYFATNAATGFSDEDCQTLAELLPILSSIMDVRMKNRLTRTLLNVYVGPHAAEAILSGTIRRGDGVTVEAAVVIADLRGFTAISEQYPRDAVIALLNEYFDVLCEPIERHGGEILKFMGDGLLAIFPGDAASAVRAVSDMRKGMAALNATRRARGSETLGFGVGANYGDVMYGNIGSCKRLDFTVIGPAVNVAARLEALTKIVGRNVLFSEALIAKAAKCIELDCLGKFNLRGLSRSMEVYAFADDAVENSVGQGRQPGASSVPTLEPSRPVLPAAA
jgi:adenylate cyclase